jgi:Tol biopolymer transport system component/DNA-binding winged helix-turn-helix (wHTH) protein
VEDSANFSHRVRFGVFEVDLRAGELWKSGRKKKLTGQPFAVLAILLERPGEVVSREELQKRLWPDTFVDVDHNLNTAINKIREALSDSTEHPRFVETLSRRGYRFIAPVESVEPAAPNGAASVSEAASALTSASPATVPSVLTVEPLPAATAASKPLQWARAAAWPAIAIAALVLAWVLRPTLPPPQVTDITQLTRDGTHKLFGEGDSTIPLLTDGSRVYYTQVTSSFHSTVMQISTEGGEAVSIEIPFSTVFVSDISPNQSEMLVKTVLPGSNACPLWLLRLPGGAPRRVGDFLVVDAAWSPDGTAIYYSTGKDIYKANSDGGQSQKILTTNGTAFWLRFSPSGRVLRFSVQDPKLLTSSLWEAQSDGSHQRPLLAGWSSQSDECCGNWTSDGKYFIFQSTTRDGLSNLWATREKEELWHKVSHEPVQLTLGQTSAQAPLPSRDGRRIFFVGSTQRGELVRYDPKTRAFAPYRSGPSAEMLVFTKDGNRVAYLSYPDNVLWQSKTDGSDRRKLTLPPMQVVLPRWSPDGTRIAFSGREPGKAWQIFVVAADGGVPEQLTSGNIDYFDPTWSPDGNSLVFGENGFITGNQADPWQSAIHIINLKTRQITTVPGSAGLFSPRWSPDGRYLAAMPDDYQKQVLYDFSRKKWEDLVKMRGGYQNWSHDGKCIYFVDAFQKEIPVYRVCLSDRKLEHVADLSLAGDLAPWWTGLAPDDSILTTRDTGIEEIYALDTKFP